MPRYRYRAKDLEGKVHKGVREVSDDRALLKALAAEGLYCYQCSLGGGSGPAGSPRLKQKLLPMLCRQLSVMLAAGVSLSKVLAVSSEAAQDRVLKKTLLELREGIHKGRTLSEAMKGMPGVFPDLLVHMVRTGETSGRLDGLLEKMADYYAREEELDGKVRAAMTYPVILLIVTALSAVFMLTTVLPQFAAMLQEQELPWITRVMMGISSHLQSHGLLYLLAVPALAALSAGILKHPLVRLRADTMLLHIPVLGTLLRTVYTSRFASAFGVLYGSGIGILEAMYTVEEVMGNACVKQGLKHAAERLKGGVMLSQALKELDLFQPVLVSMAAAGEESGALDTVLETAGDYYEKEAAMAINQMIALLEPAMILVLALIVGSVVMAVMMPVFHMYTSML